MDNPWAIWKNAGAFETIEGKSSGMGILKRNGLFLLLLLVTATVGAETRYVTDQFKITLRSGQTSTHKILRMLPSGTPVQVLEGDAAAGYAKVKTKDGTTGWVLTRHLDNIPSARDRIAAIQKKLDGLSEENQALKSQLAELREARADLAKQHQTLQASKADTDQELESIRRTASNAVRIANERKALTQKVSELEFQLNDMRQENHDLKSNTAQEWFIKGAGVIVLGIILGLILPRIRLRRRSSWDSL